MRASHSYQFLLLPRPHQRRRCRIEMNADLGLSQATYGLSSATFYVGYCLFEVPGSVILERLARWIKDATGSYSGGLYGLAAFTLFSALIAAVALNIPRELLGSRRACLQSHRRRWGDVVVSHPTEA